MINKVYAFLSKNSRNTENLCYCYNDPVYITSDTGNVLLDALHKKVPSDMLEAFSLAICINLKNSEFYLDIIKLDPNNTYDKELNDFELLPHNIYKYMPSYSELNKLIPYLDTDIKDRILCPNIFTYISAFILQILRELQYGD